MRPLLPVLLGCAAPAAPVEPACRLVARGHGPDAAVTLDVRVVASGLEVPWALAFLPDGGMLVTERPGRLRRIDAAGRLLPEPVLVVDVASGGEGGLLGLAVDPAFATTRRFFLYETRDGGGTSRVARYVLAPDGTAATLDRVVLDGIPAARFHDGGRLRFGPDGYLWVGTGDARQPALAQDPGSLAGKVLRVDVDGRPAPDDPFPGSPAWVIGARNVQAFGWLPDGRLVIADHGPSGEVRGLRGHDEVTVAGPGANLGWPDVVGCEAREGLTAPAISWAEANPPGGLAVLRTDAIPGWRGDVVVGVLGFGDDTGHLQHLRLDEAGRVVLSEQVLRGTHGRLRDVVEGPDGALYVTTSTCDGRGTCGPDEDAVLRVAGR